MTTADLTRDELVERLERDDSAHRAELIEAVADLFQAVSRLERRLENLRTRDTMLGSLFTMSADHEDL